MWMKYCRCTVPSVPFSSYPVANSAPCLVHAAMNASHVVVSGLLSVPMNIIPFVAFAILSTLSNRFNIILIKRLDRLLVNKKFGSV